MNKLTMAHERAKQIMQQRPLQEDGTTSCYGNYYNRIAHESWQYADAMQDEADKREHKHLFPNGQPCACGVSTQDVVGKIGEEWQEIREEQWQPDTYPEYEHGRDYPSDAWVTFNGEARLAVSIEEDSLRKRPQGE